MAWIPLNTRKWCGKQPCTVKSPERAARNDDLEYIRYGFIVAGSEAEPSPVYGGIFWNEAIKPPKLQSGRNMKPPGCDEKPDEYFLKETKGAHHIKNSVKSHFESFMAAARVVRSKKLLMVTADLFISLLEGCGRRFFVFRLSIRLILVSLIPQQCLRKFHIHSTRGKTDNILVVKGQGHWPLLAF